MMGHASKEILFFFLITCIYRTCGILMTNPTKLPSIVHSYLPPRTVPVSMSSSKSILYANHKYDIVDEPEEILGKQRDRHRLEASYVRSDSRPVKVSLPFKDDILQTFDRTDKMDSLNRNRERLTSMVGKFIEISTKNPNNFEEHRRLVNSQYKVKEEIEKKEEEEEDYVVGENTSIDLKGRSLKDFRKDYFNPNKSYRHSEDITDVMKFLDHFLSRTLNGNSYNNELHQPTNPFLALLLSRYGKYVPGLRNPRLYSYMAVNNIHNNRPFGQYKQECEEEPRR